MAILNVADIHACIWRSFFRDHSALIITASGALMEHDVGNRWCVVTNGSLYRGRIVCPGHVCRGLDDSQIEHFISDKGSVIRRITKSGTSYFDCLRDEDKVSADELLDAMDEMP